MNKEVAYIKMLRCTNKDQRRSHQVYKLKCAIFTILEFKIDN
jgi:hypothetical protein